MAGGNSFVKELLQRSHFNVVHHGLQDHVGNVHISASDVCIVEGHALIIVRLIGQGSVICRAFLFWAVFEKTYKVHILHSAVELEQASGAGGCRWIVHADHHATSKAAMPTPMAMAVK